MDNFLKDVQGLPVVLSSYVDDFTIVYKFKKTVHAMQLAAAEIAFNTRRLHKNLREEGLILEPDKCKIISRDKEMITHIESAFGDLGYKGIDDLKLLGVDWMSNEAIGCATATKRIAKATRAVRNPRSYPTVGIK